MGRCFPFPCSKRCQEPKIQTEALYTEYLSVLQSDDPTIGLEGINWFDSIYPNLFSHKSRLVYRFNKHYQLREIGREDTEQWMKLLQDRFDEIADKYNHAYKVYDDESIKLDNLGLGYVRTVVYGNTRTGSANESGNSSSDSKFKDTPSAGNSTINNPTTENVDVSYRNGSSSFNDRLFGDTTEKYDYNDKHIINEANELIEKYKQLDEQFIREFNQMFIGILSVWC